MPDLATTRLLRNAASATDNAERVRKFHARRTPKASPQRIEDIRIALDKLRDAMKPLRTLIGRFPYGPQTTEAETTRELIREASDAIQRERRKLWKMRGGTT